MSQPVAPHRLQPGARLTTAGGQPVLVRAWRGEGSYARVYQCDYAGTAGALKLAKAEIEDAAERLDGEREVLGAIRHPHVVRLLGHGRHGAVPFLVLEWLDGDTLHDLLARRRRLALRQALEIMEALCDAVTALHYYGLVHGDIRPQNLIVVPQRCAVLTDPGSGYPPQPECARSTPAGDVRAVGGLFYLMLTGEPATGGGRLSVSAGYNRGAVQLWERTLAQPPASADELLTAVQALRRSL